MFINPEHITNQIIQISEKYSVTIKREDMLHPEVSGNKFRKLTYNFQHAKNTGYKTILTFGGAYSNHIAAVAKAGEITGFKTIGIIRGEELVSKIDNNPTLKFAQACGMQLEFISRDSYRDKSSTDFLTNLKSRFGEVYIIPEGGTNDLAVKGCEDILTEDDAQFDYICCPVGTGGTISGLINSSHLNQKILGFPALKGSFLRKDISKFAKQANWDLITDYHFGGYAKINTELISFINNFKIDYGIPLDPIYTGKMFYGILDLMKTGYFDANAQILAIHTGGLQGIAGMNNYLEQKKMPLIT